MSEPENQLQSQHHYPHPLVRRFTMCLMAVIIMLLALLIIVQAMLAIHYGALFWLGVIIAGVVLVPILMRTVLHPEIDVYSDGLLLRPMLWPVQHIAWAEVQGIAMHPMIFNDPILGRHLHGKNYHPREGATILVSRKAKLWLPYRILGSIVGTGNTPAFAISNTTHRNYIALATTIQEHIEAAMIG